MWIKCLHDDWFEFLKLFARDGLFFDLQLGEKQLSPRFALVDAKAAMTPRESETDSSLLRLPGDSFTPALRSRFARS